MKVKNDQEPSRTTATFLVLIGYIGTDRRHRDPKATSDAMPSFCPDGNLDYIRTGIAPSVTNRCQSQPKSGDRCPLVVLFAWSTACIAQSDPRT